MSIYEKKSKFSEEQITIALHTAESSTSSVNEVCRKLGIIDATFYRWKSIYQGYFKLEKFCFGIWGPEQGGAATHEWHEI